MKEKIKKYILKKWYLNIVVFLIFLIILIIAWIKIIGDYLEKQEILLKLENIKIEKQKVLDLKIKEEEQEKIILELQKLQEEKKNIYLKNIDLDSDDSLTKFVNNKIHFKDLWYIPKNLVEVSWKYIIDWKNWYIKVKKELKTNLEKLSKKFYNDTGNTIVVVSWYRSYNYQKGIKDRGCSDKLCAKAWYSEHQSGLAIDIYSASSQKDWLSDNNLREHFWWFNDNAHEFWFHNTYQKWFEIDWYEIEPWHWRYVWEKLASYLYENKLTIAEFYYKKEVEKNIKW